MSRKVFNYKGVKVNIFGIPTEGKRIIPKTKRVRKFYNISFVSSFSKDAPKNLIVMYDIPFEKKKERDWFRRQLKNFDYIMIQKSVWVGPSPLPKSFIDYVKGVGLESGLKTFKLAQPYTGKEKVF